MLRELTILSVVVLTGLAGRLRAAIPGFYVMDRPADIQYLAVGGVSDDGSVVVGHAKGSTFVEAFRWTAATGRLGVGYRTASTHFDYANDVSGDGSVIVGRGYINGQSAALRWTQSEGIVSLGELPAGSQMHVALGISADGSVIVGECLSSNGREAFRWTAEQGMVGLGDLPGGTFLSSADAISADGSVAVGRSISDLGWEASSWQQGDAPIGLGILDGGYTTSYARAVSADGSVIVGNCYLDGIYQAFRWTAQGGMVGLGDLPGGVFSSKALGVSADGSIVVGRGTTAAGIRPFIWDEVNGVRDLVDVLANDYHLDLGSFRLETANAISADGSVIVGVGENTVWVAVIPEPATLSLLVLGGLAIIRRWRSAAAVLVVVGLVGVVFFPSAASADVFGTGANQFTIDFVTISGDASAANGTSFGGYSPTHPEYRTFSDPGDYRMGTYENTNAQYDKFKASLGVPVFGNPSDAYNAFPFRYEGEENLPSSEVSWYEAAQFVNWLNTYKGHQPAYNFTGTQGTSDYTLTTWSVAEAEDGTNLFRHKDAFYYLPTEDEWVKAGHWNGTFLQTHTTKAGESLYKGDGVSGSGWNYDYALDPAGPWDVGSGSEELNGTFDMIGNLGEWTESPRYPEQYEITWPRRVHGGGAGSSDWQLESLHYGLYGPQNELNFMGFRVASNIPEPATLSLLGLGGFALIRRRRE